MVLPSFVARVLGALKSFLARHQRPADPLDALYDRLAVESERLITEKVEQFNQTPRHES